MSLQSPLSIPPEQSKPVAGSESLSQRLGAYVELTKLRISVMVVITFVVAAMMAAPSMPTAGVMIWGTLGMLLIAGSGNAMNMLLERRSDFLMARTAGRPLPAQRLTAIEVTIFGVVTLLLSIAILGYFVNWPTAICGLANWVLYVLIYTPMKRKTWLNTEVGAVAGALPVLMGALATSTTIPIAVWAFFGVLFLWQFPHFMAIAWKYREQYRDGGLQMLTVVDPTGARAGRKAVVTCALLIATSLVPAFFVRSWGHGLLLAVVALVVGVYYMKASLRFNQQPNDETAKKLLRSSLLYLPLYMLGLMVACLT